MKMPMGAERVVARSYMAFAFASGLVFGLNCHSMGPILPWPSMATGVRIIWLWVVDVEKITNDVIS